MQEADFVGTWRLISMEGRLSDGTVTYPLGADTRGYIMYAPDGYVSVVISGNTRPSLGTSDLLAGSDEQLAAAARTFISYAGRYSVDGELVRHAVDISLFPDWAGGIQERHYRFEGNRLTLSTDPILWGGKERTAVLVWERVPDCI